MAWGEKIDQFNIMQGETLEVSVDLESREYNGRWYTDVKAWKVSRDGADDGRPYSSSSQDPYEAPSATSIDNTDIPFWRQLTRRAVLLKTRVTRRAY